MFVTSPASPFVDTITKIPTATLNYWRGQFPNALDAVNGGTYNVQAAHVINFPAGGGYWNIDAQLQASDVNVPSGGVLDLDSGAVENVNSGASIQVKGTNALNFGAIEWQQYAWAQFDSGSLLWVKPGGNFSMQGSQNVAGGSGNRTIYVGVDSVGPGHVVVDGTGTATGSDVTVKGGAALTLTDNTTLLTVGNGADMTVTSATSVLRVTSGAGLTVTNTAGSALLQSSSTQIDNLDTTTQIGLFTKSGTSAKTALRYGTIASPDADKTFDPSQYDVIDLYGVTLTADRTWTLSAPSGNICATVMIIGAPGGGHTLHFANTSVPIFDLLDYATHSGGVGVILVFEKTHNRWIQAVGWGAAYSSTLP